MDRRNISIAAGSLALTILGFVNAGRLRMEYQRCTELDARPDISANCGGLPTDVSFYGSILLGLAGVALLAWIVLEHRGEDGPPSLM